MYEHTQVVVQTVCLFVGSFFLIPRYYVRIYCYGPLRHWSTYRWSEIFVLITWLDWVMQIIFSDVRNLGPRNFDGSPSDVQYAAKTSYFILVLWYTPGFYPVRAALLLWYMELCPKATNPKLWKAFIATWCVFVYGLISHFCWVIFGCGFPLSRWWRTEYGYGRPCRVTHGYYIVTQTPHFISDMLVFILPFFILYQLKHLRRQIIGAAIMFSLGIFNIICSVVVWVQNLLLVYMKTNRITLFPFGNYFLFLKFFVYIVVVCVPYVKKSYVDFQEWRGRGKTGRPKLFKSGVFSTIRGRRMITEQNGPEMTIQEVPPARLSTIKGPDIEVGVGSLPTSSDRGTNTSN